jgi:hypothetical protein
VKTFILFAAIDLLLILLYALVYVRNAMLRFFKR